MNARGHSIRSGETDLVVLLAVIVVTGACERITEPDHRFPVPRSSMTQMTYDTLQFRSYWEQTAICGGIDDIPPLERVTFYSTTADIPGHKSDGREVNGKWVPPHTILLEEDHDGNNVLIRHEMLHDLLQDGGHPNPPFPKCSYLNVDTSG